MACKNCKKCKHLEFKGANIDEHLSEIKIRFTYYHDPVTLEHLKQMIPVTQADYNRAKDVWELPYKVFLRNTGDGRYYCMNKGETDFEYRCIIAEEYYKGEPYEGVILGFIADPIPEQVLKRLAPGNY